MTQRNRVCIEPGCPSLQPDTRCAKHALPHTTHTRTTTQRGYGAHHRKLRDQWKPKVETGQVKCARCQHPIRPGTQWDLGHDDNDRTQYRGPEHAHCNRSRKTQPSRGTAQANLSTP